MMILDWEQKREEMVQMQLVARGIRATAVLAAMRQVPRHCFVPEAYQEFAYEDTPLPLPAAQTISQPYIVALMLSGLKLQPSDRVLEIGTGSGYAAAVLSQIVAEVYTIERHEELVNYARQRLERLGYRNVWLRCGDGTLGWPEAAPFQAILVSAGAPAVPPPLKEQLAINGRLIMPVGPYGAGQILVQLTRQGTHKFARKKLGAVTFVPLVSQAKAGSGI